MPTRKICSDIILHSPLAETDLAAHSHLFTTSLNHTLSHKSSSWKSQPLGGHTNLEKIQWVCEQSGSCRSESAQIPAMALPWLDLFLVQSLNAGDYLVTRTPRSSLFDGWSGYHNCSPDRRKILLSSLCRLQAQTLTLILGFFRKSISSHF